MSILAKWPCDHVVTHEGVSPAGKPEEMCPFCRLEDLERCYRAAHLLIEAAYGYRAAADDAEGRGELGQPRLEDAKDKWAAAHAAYAAVVGESGAKVAKGGNYADGKQG